MNLWNLGYPADDLYEKRLRFPGCQRAIVRCQEGQPGAATAQPWNAWFSVCILKDKWSYLCFSHHWTLAQLHLHFALIMKIFDNLMHCMCKSSVYMKQCPNSNLRNHCYDNGIFHNGLYPRYLLDEVLTLQWKSCWITWAGSEINFLIMGANWWACINFWSPEGKLFCPKIPLGGLEMFNSYWS